VSVTLQNGFWLNAYSVRFTDAGGLTWSFNAATNSLSASAISVASNFADDAAAAAGGIAVGGLYHNAGAVRVRRT
jgi:hypothetical protein